MLHSPSAAELPQPKAVPLVPFVAVALLMVGLSLLGWALNSLMLVVVPAGLAITLLALINFRPVLLLAVFLFPLKVNQNIGPLNLDVPTEPLLALLAAVAVFQIFQPSPSRRLWWRQPLAVLLVLQMLWAAFLIPFSVEPAASGKFLAVKLWYILPLVGLTTVYLNTQKAFKVLFWIVFGGVWLMVMQSLIRHSATGFAFGKVHAALRPFILNHVLYTCMVGMVVPLAWVARTWYARNSLPRIFLNSSILLFLLAIATAHTRATWLAMPLGVVYALLIRFRLDKPAVLLGLLTVVGALAWVLNNNRFMDFAPDFEKTVSHGSKLDQHLEATFQGTDISGMERVHRWVAAKNMFAERPITGFGPNTFYPTYQGYTLERFRTYVSNNPERSTMHNQFLFYLVEQGLVGMLLFAFLYVYALLLAGRMAATHPQPWARHWSAALGVSLLVLLVHLMLNDLIEAMENGLLYFLILAQLMVLRHWQRHPGTPAAPSTHAALPAS